MPVTLVTPRAYEEVEDLMDGYFQAVREYNRWLGAYEMSLEDLQEAKDKEALNYAKVKRLREKLIAMGVFV